MHCTQPAQLGPVATEEADSCGASRSLCPILCRPPCIEALADRIEECSQVLGFAWVPEKDDSNVLTLLLREARFCRVRHCPVCQWRRY
ncbi:hypothetical protein SBA4_860009 [Candidatus Sulfopaludibacter sp. SbA4]|nr:hypothetical protein SBA4_860009 [Candidatus Sulfopaludibacter sp. SbA4]